MRRSACLVVYHIEVDNYASLSNCTPVGGASDSLIGPQATVYNIMDDANTGNT